jgi:hypothetical protein
MIFTPNRLHDLLDAALRVTLISRDQWYGDNEQDEAGEDQL